MTPNIVSQKVVFDLYRQALKTLDRDAAVLDVAGRTGHDVVTIEGVLASREARQSAVMEGVAV